MSGYLYLEWILWMFFFPLLLWLIIIHEQEDSLKPELLLDLTKFEKNNFLFGY